MIFGIGTDIFEINRIKDAMERDAGFSGSIFTIDEISYCEKFINKYEHYAARFAAKEAFLKAFGTGWRNGISFRDIEIYNDDLGKPFIRLLGKAAEQANQVGITSAFVTVSHTRDLATATVILEKDD
jgi:holo-[acyl-carrier protein] synthase